MVEVFNYHEQVEITTMKPSQLLDYNQFFKQLYKLPQSGTINRTHVLVAECLDWKTMGFRLKGGMALAEGTQNPTRFKKERQ